jgi:ribosomal-protein-serine acetyltransferase
MSPAWTLRLPDEIRGEGFTLRHATDADAEAFTGAVLESVATVGRFMTWAHARYRREDALAWFALCRERRARAEGLEYSIFDDDGRLLGGAGLCPVNPLHRFANLGYWTRASAERQGVASSAAGALARAGICEAGLFRVEIVIDPVNVGSVRVAEKIGAVREGVLRRRIFVHGEARDAVIYSLVQSDL